MELINELQVSLNGYFGWNKARMACFVNMLLALIVTRATNLNKLACAFASDAQQLSRYRRLQRFFANFKIDYDLVAGFIYGLRWEIETLFGCLKGRGFNFEDTRITNRERIKKILVLLAVAFCWAHKTGEWRHEIKPIKIKMQGRAAVSLFRYELDYRVDAVLKLFYQPDLFKTCLNKISEAEEMNVLGIPS